jgi:BclB C-terminal domain-containing protein
MATSLGGLNNQSSLIGFGGSFSGVVINGGTIDLTGGPGIASNFAFSAAEASSITSISGFFSTSAGLSLVGSTVTVTVQVFASTTPDNVFTAIPGATVDLELTGLNTVGTTINGITTGLNIPVPAQTRLLLVATPNVTAGLDIATEIDGYVSAGVTLSGGPL